MKFLYLLLTIAGSIDPWFWLIQDPSALLSPTLFLQLAFASTIAIVLTTDLLILAIVFFCFVWIELKRLNISRLWLILHIGLIPSCSRNRNFDKLAEKAFRSGNNGKSQ